MDGRAVRRSGDYDGVAADWGVRRTGVFGGANGGNAPVHPFRW